MEVEILFCISTKRYYFLSKVLPTSSIPPSGSDSIVNTIRLRHNEDVSLSESQKIQESFHFWISLCLEFGIEAVVVTLQRLVTLLATFPEQLVSSASRQQTAGWIRMESGGAVKNSQLKSFLFRLC